MMSEAIDPEQIIEIVADVAQVPVGSVHDDSLLKEELELDSVDMIEIVTQVDKISHLNQGIVPVKTVGDLIKEIRRSSGEMTSVPSDELDPAN